MEIDFLGLKSSRFRIEHEGSNNVFTDTASGGVETSLSLSTSSSLDSHREVLNFSEKKKKKWEFAGGDKMIPSCSGSTLYSLGPYSHENSTKVEQHSLLLMATPVYRRPSSAAGFLYDLNDAAAASLRNISELPSEPPTSLHMLYPPSPTVFSEPQKAESSMYVAGNGNASTGLSRSGYTPTVAMARRATLARFLEKRLHRMNQGSTSHVMGRSLNGTNSETGETCITKSNKKRNSTLKRRS